MGSTLNRFGASVYSTFLYRLALPVVKLTRSVINVPGNIIVIPAIILLFAAFIILDGGVHLAYMFAVKGGISFQAAWMGAVAGLVRTLLDLVTLLTWLIIIRVLMSWISPDPSNPVVQFIVAVTEPVMEPFRKIVPPVGFIDLSPIILIFALQFLKILLVKFAALVM
jgi:YggT family protein